MSESHRTPSNPAAGKFTDITDDAVDRARDLARQTAQQMDSGEYGLDACFKSMSSVLRHHREGLGGAFLHCDRRPVFRPSISLRFLRRRRKSSLTRSATTPGGSRSSSLSRTSPGHRWSFPNYFVELTSGGGAEERGAIHPEGATEAHALHRQELRCAAGSDRREQRARPRGCRLSGGHRRTVSDPSPQTKIDELLDRAFKAL